MRKAKIPVIAAVVTALVLAAPGWLRAARCYSPEGERIRSYEQWLIDNPDSDKARAISRAVRLYNERRRTERETHNARVRRTGIGYLWKELADPAAMGDLVKQGYHIPVKAWDPQGNLIYDVTSESRYAGEHYGGPPAKDDAPVPAESRQAARSHSPPKANRYAPGWQREVGYNFETPRGAVPPVSTAYAYGDKEVLADIPGIYFDKLGMPCVRDTAGKLRQLFKGSDNYWYAVDEWQRC